MAAIEAHYKKEFILSMQAKGKLPVTMTESRERHVSVQRDGFDAKDNVVFMLSACVRPLMSQLQDAHVSCGWNSALQQALQHLLLCSADSPKVLTWRGQTPCTFIMQDETYYDTTDRIFPGPGGVEGLLHGMIRETTKRIDKVTGNRGGWASASPVPVDVTLAAAAAAAPGSEARAPRQTRSERHKSMKVCSQGLVVRQVKARMGEPGS